MTTTGQSQAPANVTQINRGRHDRLRVTRRADFSHAAHSHVSPLVIGEFASAASDYPIILIKDADTGTFRAAALFGFGAGENVYHNAHGWNATYVPMNVSRYPFVIGVEDDDAATPVLCIDEASGRLTQDGDGDALFDAQGNETAFLSQARQQMQQLYDGERQTSRFIADILSLRLIAPFHFSLSLADGETRKITGLYGIDQDRLNALDDANLVQLCRAGHMLALHAMIVSQRQLNRMAQLHNAQSTNAILRVSLLPNA